MTTQSGFRFEKLEVWHGARALAVSIYRATDTFPREEQFGLTSQMRRAVVSIGANIAEGSGKNSDRDFARFLEQSYGSAMEIAALLALAADLNFLTSEEAGKLQNDVRVVAARIAALNRSLGEQPSKVTLPPRSEPSTVGLRPSTPSRP
jgi:four helix bundle protein